MRSRIEAAIEERLVLLPLRTFSIYFTFTMRFLRYWFLRRELKIFSTEYFLTVLGDARKVSSIFTTSNSYLLVTSEHSQASRHASICTMSSLCLTDFER